jgi:hypothetical protein
MATSISSLVRWATSCPVPPTTQILLLVVSPLNAKANRLTWAFNQCEGRSRIFLRELEQRRWKVFTNCRSRVSIRTNYANKWATVANTQNHSICWGHEKEWDGSACLLNTPPRCRNWASTVSQSNRLRPISIDKQDVLELRFHINQFAYFSSILSPVVLWTHYTLSVK